ncbi:MAG: DUF4124 domain-containing protein [Methylobacter sp.]
MKKIFFILLTLLTASAHSAEVFKCQLKSGKTVYQSLPCESAVKQQAIEIQQPDPRKVAEEEAKLKAWKEDFAVREAARIKAEQEQQAEQDRKASVETLNKSAEYQKQQADEAKRQADMQEQQYMQNPYYQRYQFYPYYPINQSLPPYPSRVPQHHNIKEKTDTGTHHQSKQTELKIPKEADPDSSKPKFLWKGE